MDKELKRILTTDSILLTEEEYERRLNFYENLALLEAEFNLRGGVMTVDEFNNLKHLQNGDCVGVYILHNEHNGMFYVGQATRLFFRVNQHFTGHGNGNVYSDFRNGDKFTIKLIKLTESYCSDLDELERNMISKYNSYEAGYNRTSGNGK